MISELLREFIATADTHVVGQGYRGSPSEIIARRFTADFNGLDVKGSFGQGRASAVPWIGFLGYGQIIPKGIYPVLLYFKHQDRLVLAYGVSETRPPAYEWKGIEGRETIKEYFRRKGLGVPAKYGSSFVHQVYDTTIDLDEEKIRGDLDGVIAKFHEVFENRAPELGEDQSSLNPAIVSSLNGSEVKTLLSEVDFYFEKGRQMLSRFESVNASTESLNQLWIEYDAAVGDFNQKLGSFPPDSESLRLLQIMGRLISYCDNNAANKNTYNEYDDKRTLARAGVRQGVWVNNLIKYKLSNHRTDQVADSIGNAISYLKNPMTQLTMLSESHREMVSRNLLKRPRYSKEEFVGDVLDYFEPYSISPTNPENLTRIVSNILYHFGDVKALWYENQASGREHPIPSPIDNEGPSVNFRTIGFSDDHRAILTAIKTKPFVLLAGLSGTGKSRLVRTLAYKTCSLTSLQSESGKPGNFELIPVRPNWHDSAELFGYITRISGEKYVVTPFLRFVTKAWRHASIPFFLCLDEMNLAPVEQYFAEYLSIAETRSTHGGEVKSDYLISKSQFDDPRIYDQILKDLKASDFPPFADGISIPNNLIVVGTVNMDETTHSFSRKVLDRAMTIEMNQIELSQGLGESDLKSDWSYPEHFISSESVLGGITTGSEVFPLYAESAEVMSHLTGLNEIFADSPFKVAFRVRDEFLMYCYHTSMLPNLPLDWLSSALDEMTAMKVLSRIEGDGGRTSAIISHLLEFLSDDFVASKRKLLEMDARLRNEGYTSFWA